MFAVFFRFIRQSQQLILVQVQVLRVRAYAHPLSCVSGWTHACTLVVLSALAALPSEL